MSTRAVSVKEVSVPSSPLTARDQRRLKFKRQLEEFSFTGVFDYSKIIHNNSTSSSEASSPSPKYAVREHKSETNVLDKNVVKVSGQNLNKVSNSPFPAPKAPSKESEEWKKYFNHRGQPIHITVSEPKEVKKPFDNHTETRNLDVGNT